MAVKLSALPPAGLYVFLASGTHLCYMLSKPLGIVRPERLGKWNKFINLIGSRIRDPGIVAYCIIYYATACPV
jgi:hypothetical protein